MELDHPRALGRGVGRLLRERFRSWCKLNDEVAVRDNSDLKRAAGDWSRGCTSEDVHDCCGARFVVCGKGAWCFVMGVGHARDKKAGCA